MAPNIIVILILLTNKNIALIYYVNNKKKDLAPSGSYQQLSLMFAAFHGHSTVLTMSHASD